MTNLRYDTNQKSTSIYTSHFLFYFILITQKFIIFWPWEMIKTFTITLSFYWVNLFKLFMKCLVLLIPVMFCKKDWLEQYNNDISLPYNISCIRIISYLGSSHCSNSKNVPVGHYLDISASRKTSWIIAICKWAFYENSHLARISGVKFHCDQCSALSLWIINITFLSFRIKSHISMHLLFCIYYFAQKHPFTRLCQIPYFSASCCRP